MNIFTNLARAASAHPEHPAIIFEGQALGYGLLWQRSLCMASELRARGVKKGDVVALFLPNDPLFVISYFACQAIGAVPLSINAMFRGDEIAFLLSDSRARGLVTCASLAEQLPEAVAALGLAVAWCDGELIPPDFEPLPSLDGPSAAAPIPLDPSDPAAILYTSGTTGVPKGVVLSQMNVVGNVAAVAHAMALTPADRLLCFLPLSHCFGQNHIVGGAIRAGATVVLQRRFDLMASLMLSQEARVSYFFGVPTVYRRILASPQAVERLRGVRYAFSAAAAMDPATASGWRQALGRPIWEGYGLTETSPFAAYNHPFTYRPGSVGVAIDGVEIAIEGEGGERLPEGELGEIIIRGPNVMKGYLGRPEETAHVLRGGWFHTGDIGRLDEDGCLYLVDRLKDMINCAGFKIWPREVEERLSQGPGVAQAAVVGVPDDDLGERAVAVIVPKGDGPFEAAALLSWARAQMAAYKVPREVVVAPLLPTSPSGKVLRRELRVQLTREGKT